VEVGELVIRGLLTAPVRDGGLIGRVPQAAMEAPRQAVEEVAVMVTNPVEHEAGQQALMKHAAGNARLQEELQAGRQALAKYR
jgi:hypothetical protein